jgi:selenide, water dikinase
VLGLVRPDRVLRNTGAKSGDVLILSKALGVGVISAALKSGRLDPEVARTLYASLVDSTTRLNAVGHALATVEQVHAMTDVTGFGLLGHGLEMCRGSKLRAHIEFDALPLLDSVADLAQIPYRTGAANRNWSSYSEEVMLASTLAEWQRDVLCDPQTSGGLLVAVEPAGAAKVLEMLRTAGFDGAAVIGELRDGKPAVEVA